MASMLVKFIAERVPKINLEIGEGFCYHRDKNSLAFLNGKFEFSSNKAFNSVNKDGTIKKDRTHLQYLGYEVLDPETTARETYLRKASYPYDLAPTHTYLVQYRFQYANEPEIRKINYWVPYIEIGNLFTVSDRRLLVMPVLSDKVVSIGDEGVFINIVVAKYNFFRQMYSIYEDGIVKLSSVVHTKLFINPPIVHTKTTRAKSTVIHYLLSYYGYSKTMELILGFVPTPTYSTLEDGQFDPKEWVRYESTGARPRSYIIPTGSSTYDPNKIAFMVPRELNDAHVQYIIGNLLYVLDHFPGGPEANVNSFSDGEETNYRIDIDGLDNPSRWRRLMGEIIYTGNHSLSTLMNIMNLHFDGLNRQFDVSTVSKLEDIGIESECLIDLLGVIQKNFLTWIITNGNNRRLVGNKTLEAESVFLNKITYGVTLLFFDINKEEVRNDGMPLEPKVVDKIFKDRLKPNAILGIRNEKAFVTDVEVSTDHIYTRLTSRLVYQESDYADVSSGTANTSLRRKLVADHAVIGSLLNLPKPAPSPDQRINPYMHVDPVTGTVLPHVDLEDILRETDAKLSATHQGYVETVVDDELDIDTEDFESDVEDEVLEDEDDE